MRHLKKKSENRAHLTLSKDDTFIQFHSKFSTFNN